MKIIMLDTVEDTHRHVIKGDDGKEVVIYTTLHLTKDKEYSDEGLDWDDRAQGLVNNGFAKKSDEEVAE